MEEELRIAAENARSVPGAEDPERLGMIYIGTIQVKEKNYHYYKSEDSYFYETDSDRQMRTMIKQNKWKNKMPIC